MGGAGFKAKWNARAHAGHLSPGNPEPPREKPPRPTRGPGHPPWHFGKCSGSPRPPQPAAFADLPGSPHRQRGRGCFPRAENGSRLPLDSDRRRQGRPGHVPATCGRNAGSRDIPETARCRLPPARRVAAPLAPSDAAGMMPRVPRAKKTPRFRGVRENRPKALARHQR